MEFGKTMMVAASGLRVQALRMRLIAENLANASSSPQSAQDEPYRRKLLTFRNVLDRENGVQLVKPGRQTVDRSEFTKRYDPGHPAADADGYVNMPNVNSLVEVMDMREAQRSYEANLKVIESSRQMLMRTIRILEG